MKYLSLFSGIGGFELGITNAYENLSKRQGKKQRRNARNRSDNDKQSVASQQSTCIGFSEIDRYATEIYQKRFPNHKNYGDITKIKTAELPNFDLLVGGFPCQAFSIAGKRRGFDDTRGTLFFEIARILKNKKPKQFVLENVKGLLSHNNGQTFATIIATLTELGYDLQWQVLNSKDFGVPQNRERMFIVGHLRGKSRPQVFPLGQNGEISDEAGTADEPQPQAKLAATLRTRQGQRADDNFVLSQIGVIDSGGVGGEAMRVYDSKGISRTIKNGGGMGAKTGLYSINTAIRRLTPTECERLQGFPDGWTEGLSDTQRYKCLGNAVTVNVIKAIIKKMI